MRSKYSDEQLELAVANSNNIRQVLTYLGLSSNGGGGYATASRRIKNLNLNTSHFTSNRCWNRGKKLGARHNVADYLILGSLVSSNRLRILLLDRGVLDRSCNMCGLSNWLGSEIPLELDHINGDHIDNRLENLRVLCPNCHAQTSTYCGRNKKKLLQV